MEFAAFVDIVFDAFLCNLRYQEAPQVVNTKEFPAYDDLP